MNMNQDPGQDFHDWPADSWIDPTEERARFRMQLQRQRVGFSLLGLAMIVACLTMIGNLVLRFQGIPLPLGEFFGIPHLELILGGIITSSALLGVCLIWGPWPNLHWQRRAGILLMLYLIGGLLWIADHAKEMGLSDADFPHEWFRNSLSSAIVWSKFALIASLSADVAVQLGEPRAIDQARSVRSLATTGAMIWFLFFALITDWSQPIWPLRFRMRGIPEARMLFLSWTVIWTICLGKCAALTLLASRCCSRTLLQMAKDDQANDLIPSRSEDGWNEMIRQSGPKGGA
jgi:hypothetical protein